VAAVNSGTQEGLEAARPWIHHLGGSVELKKALSMEMAAYAEDWTVPQAAQAMAAVSKARASLLKDFVYWLSEDFLKNCYKFFDC
jgi:hypothetical protein